MRKTVIHPIDPVYNGDCRVLILGSFPSVKSREDGFFYGHKQNRFWRVMAEVFLAEMPKTTEEKRAFLLSHGVALWDVIGACEIEGSADSSIRDATPNDIGRILRAAPIRAIYLNGKTAARYYNAYLKNKTEVDALTLPSTSAANASWSLDKLIDAWRVIQTDIEE